MVQSHLILGAKKTMLCALLIGFTMAAASKRRKYTGTFTPGRHNASEQHDENYLRNHVTLREDWSKYNPFALRAYKCMSREKIHDKWGYKEFLLKSKTFYWCLLVFVAMMVTMIVTMSIDFQDDAMKASASMLNYAVLLTGVFFLVGSFAVSWVRFNELERYSGQSQFYSAKGLSEAERTILYNSVITGKKALHQCGGRKYHDTITALTEHPFAFFMVFFSAWMCFLAICFGIHGARLQLNTSLFHAIWSVLAFLGVAGCIFWPWRVNLYRLSQENDETFQRMTRLFQKDDSLRRKGGDKLFHHNDRDLKSTIANEPRMGTRDYHQYSTESEPDTISRTRSTSSTTSSPMEVVQILQEEPSESDGDRLPPMLCEEQEQPTFFLGRTNTIEEQPKFNKIRRRLQHLQELHQ